MLTYSPKKLKLTWPQGCFEPIAFCMHFASSVLRQQNNILFKSQFIYLGEFLHSVILILVFKSIKLINIWRRVWSQWPIFCARTCFAQLPISNRYRCQTTTAPMVLKLLVCRGWELYNYTRRDIWRHWKTTDSSNIFSKITGPMILQFHIEHDLFIGYLHCKFCSIPESLMVALAKNSKNNKISFFSRTTWNIVNKFQIYGHILEYFCNADLMLLKCI